MAEQKKDTQKSPIAIREEHILAFWKANNIFEKSLEKESPEGDFVFYDGPPFATGLPHYGHILPGTIKDVIPRFKTMQGYRVPRKWGWDCHGLPIENLVEKELGLKNKKDIEDLGIEKFNDAARAAVLRYDKDWKRIIPRSGRWVDMDNNYLTMTPSYMESVWWSFKTLHDKKLIYQSFKSMYLCPRCETTLSNFEVNQGYKDVTDISVYVKFELVDEPGTFLLAWTTTPWTLPGNVALAVNPKTDYVQIAVKGEKIILAKTRLATIKEQYSVEKELVGKDLVGKTYKPVFPYYKDAKLDHKENIWKVWGADFVTTEDGTGIVHIAPGYGEDDLLLAQKNNIPFIQHVGSDGKFKKEVTDFVGVYAKPKEDPQSGDVLIIKYLAAHDALFAKEKIVHSYPHCWRCDTPLLNFATTSWFVKVTDLKDKLLAENSKVSWVPADIRDGRFGKWLEGARDWAISRSRYWGAPLPVWKCNECDKIEVFGSVDDIAQKTKSNNSYFVMRHGEAENNVKQVLSSDVSTPHHLTEEGKKEALKAAKSLKKIDVIIASDFVRTKETASIVAKALGIPEKDIVFDTRIRERDFGDLNGKPMSAYYEFLPSLQKGFEVSTPHGENFNDMRKRVGDFIYEIDGKYIGKNILVVTHAATAWILASVAQGLDVEQASKLREKVQNNFLANGEVKKLSFARLPHNRNYELDLHRPYIDEVVLTCSCGGEMKRVPEVFDTWYESGSMTYGQKHYPFEGDNLALPADFIAEGLDQTRGWFYSLLVLAVGLFGKAPYKNVVVNGLILAEDGRKMSKRFNNYPEVDDMFDKYGADALRYYLLSSPAVKAEEFKFSEKAIDDIMKKVLMRLDNVYSFYEMYAGESLKGISPKASQHVLDVWILSRLHELNHEITASLNKYEMDRATRPIADFVDDLSTWYLRRSRDRFKGDDETDKKRALATTQFVLREFSKLIAPFMPFAAEDLYQKVKTPDDAESVHLEGWPEVDMQSIKDVMTGTDMKEVRRIVSLGLEARAKANIKVRQPLRSLTLKGDVLKNKKDLLALIMDEVNVKEIKFDASIVDEVALDTTLDEGLKEEGIMRDLIRAIQEMRKDANLNTKDFVVLSVSTDDSGKKLIESKKKEITKTVQAKEIVYVTSTEGKEIKLDDFAFKIKLIK